ncbi:uncharacterized protein LOC133306830 [Gastrolobium bilobum]|uniref:uncharacterized protein LOC133306830 n=1 Tax=Gastrolobium bilobum TaxID=150636 RepID=UPI002AB31DDA|nr:uncharacterized protein LOC133306830 [Gastrolobium bilobum]
MEQKQQPRVSRSKATHESCRGDGPTTKTTCRRRSSSSSNNNRFATADDGGGDQIECSGKYCRSCTAGLIADCVALCCCPCAVVHCFALAFVKAPWVVVRRCFGLGNKNKKKGQDSNKKCKMGHEDIDDDGDDVVVVERNREIDSVTVNAGFEAEKVWVELYQISHLDFGRVSVSVD